MHGNWLRATEWINFTVHPVMRESKRWPNAFPSEPRCISEGIRDFCVKEAIDMAVIGPEVPLSMGITDVLNEAGIRVFGPDKKCSQLEGSKSFTKSFLMKHRIPTAGYKEYTEKEALKKDIGIFGYPMVLKADGLAAGKGVILAENREESGARRGGDDGRQNLRRCGG